MIYFPFCVEKEVWQYFNTNTFVQIQINPFSVVVNNRLHHFMGADIFDRGDDSLTSKVTIDTRATVRHLCGANSFQLTHTKVYRYNVPITACITFSRITYNFINKNRPFYVRLLITHYTYEFRFLSDIHEYS